MRQIISSKTTFLHKYVWPLFMLPVVFGWLIVNLIMPSAIGLGGMLFMLAIMAAVAVPLLMLSYRLKNVSMDASNIYVEQGAGREALIPFSHVATVTQTRWIKPYPVTIHLNETSPYGKKIMFIPTFRVSFGLTEHPIVDELNQLAREARLTRHMNDSMAANGLKF